MYQNGEIYFVGTTMEDGNVAPLTNPLSKKADESVIDLSRSDRSVLANRRAVIIGSDAPSRDSVFVAFLTGSAINEDGTPNDWYRDFSPRQVNVSGSTALCSHIARVYADYLAEWRGEVTQEELARIVNEVRESGEFDELLPYLYQPEI